MESQAKNGNQTNTTTNTEVLSKAITGTSQGRTHGHLLKKKVQFNPCVCVHPVPCEDRMGTWAQDGARFRSRIHHVGVVLEPVLKTHRDTIPSDE